MRICQKCGAIMGSLLCGACCLVVAKLEVDKGQICLPARQQRLFEIERNCVRSPWQKRHETNSHTKTLANQFRRCIRVLSLDVAEQPSRPI
jgi:hypothetical protein